MRCIYIAFVIIFTTLFSLGAQQNQQKPVVVLCDLQRLQNDNTAYAVADTIKQISAYTLKTLNLYKIIEMEESPDFNDIGAVREAAVKNNADNVIFGLVDRNLTSGFTQIRLAVYDKQKDGVTFTAEAGTDSIFEVFDISEELVIELLEGFSNMHVAYGSIEFNNTGEDSDFSVFIDGDHAGDNLSVLDGVFYGERSVKVVQQRLFEEYILFDDKVTVPENGSTGVEFEIPYLTKLEEEELYRIDTAILSNMYKREGREPADNAFKEIFTRLENSSDNQLRTDLLNKYQAMDQIYGSLLYSLQTDMQMQDTPKQIPEVNTDPVFQNIGLYDGVISELSGNGTINEFTSQVSRYEEQPDPLLFYLLSEDRASVNPELIENFAGPVLKLAASRSPLFEDDFSMEKNVYDLWRDGEVKVINGELSVTAEPYQKNNTSVGIQGLGVFTGSIFEFDLKYISGMPFDNQRFNIQYGGPMGRKNGILIWFKPENRIMVTGDNVSGPLFELELLDTYKDDFIKFTIIIKNPYIALYMDNEPVALIIDPHYSGRPEERYIAFGIDNQQGSTEMRWNMDNLRIWNLDE